MTGFFSGAPKWNLNLAPFVNQYRTVCTIRLLEGKVAFGKKGEVAG